MNITVMWKKRFWTQKQDTWLSCMTGFLMRSRTSPSSFTYEEFITRFL